MYNVTFQFFTIFTKNIIADVWQCFKYVSGEVLYLKYGTQEKNKKTFSF